MGYTNSAFEFQSFAKVTGVTQSEINITGVTTVPGFADGGLPTSTLEVNDLRVIETRSAGNKNSGNDAGNDSLYAAIPRLNVSNVDLIDATLVVRREFDVTISNNSSSTVSTGTDEVFLPFDEERYTLIRDDGRTEILTEDKFEFGSGSTTLIINGLTSGTGGATLVTTIRKDKVTSKLKIKNASNALVINKSSQPNSGIGATTLNDGLTYGDYPYGTRVQDNELVLNVPDVIRVYGVFESKGTGDPESPSMSTTLMSGQSSTTNDLIIGETLTGRNSGAKAKYVYRRSDSSINFIYENQTTFIGGETVDFEDSGVSAIVEDLRNSLSKNITSSYKSGSGQRNTFYDYAKLVLNEGFLAPTRKVVVYFASASYDSADTGDITTVNSYENFDYATEIPSVRGFGCSEIIDVRPRVSNYTVSEGSRSPLEFFGRTFDGGQHSSKDVLASDESLTVNYSYYLGRKDRVYVTKEGAFYVKQGEPADAPEFPKIDTQAMNIANITLPPYLYSPTQADIKFVDHKGYQMKDIAKLETRISNLEAYTSFTMLEKATETQFAPDANGLNRFKSGIFVDNFKSTNTQDIGIGIRNSIDKNNHFLRPSHYTTSVNMEIGTESTSNEDLEFAPILGTGTKRTGPSLTLDYTEVPWFEQPFATRSESVTPFLVMFYEGNIKMVPTADQWIDVTATEPRDLGMSNGGSGFDFAGTEVTIDENGNRVGVMPTEWGSWETVTVNESSSTTSTTTTEGEGKGGRESSSRVTRRGTPEEYENWYQTNSASDRWSDGFRRIADRAYANYERTGQVPRQFMVDVTTTTQPGSSVITRTDTETTTTTDIVEERRGTQDIVTESVSTESLGSFIVNREVIHFMRSRNIQFRASRLKPFTRVYAFWDEVDVNQFCLSKLVEIEMEEGVFEVGETVTGSMVVALQNTGLSPVGLPSISFRVAVANHKSGPYNQPTDVFTASPYDRTNTLPSEYSESSTILNVDSFSLAAEDQPEYSGYLAAGMILTGESSSARARVTNIRLVSDDVGTLIGNYRVPDSQNTAFPTFETGRNKLRLTGSPTNSKIQGTFSTAAEEIFYSQGDLDTTQELTQSVRNTTIETVEVVEDRESTTVEVTTETTTETTGGDGESTTTVNGRWHDPLAQSFIVTDDTGVFITSVDLFFSAKPAPGGAQLPVTVQIREMELGVPSRVVLAFSEVSVNPSEIETSEDGSVATNIKFESPVYLEGGRTYAVVILSNSIDYRVWISRLGEVEVSTANNPESEQTLVSSQKTLGSLFKSQNASTWTPSQYEDLKFNLYRGDFVPQGNCIFFNSDLPTELEQIGSKGISADPNTIRVGLGTTVSDAGLVAGNTISQTGTSATGDFVGFAGSATGPLTITNAGVGYTPSAASFSYTGVALTTVNGNGLNATADITITNGSVTAASINAGGVGYRVGDVLTPITIGENTLGQGIRLSVADILGENELIITNVQGEFGLTPSNTILYTNSSGVTTALNYDSGSVYPLSPIRVDTDGVHMKVFHRNHGMHSQQNIVSLSGIEGDTDPQELLASVSRTSTDPISVASTEGFTEFENVGVAVSNPGYVRIGKEIISYTGLNNNTLTGVVRGVDGTKPSIYPTETLVHKYEMNGVSLRRINRTHELNFATVDNPIGLDYYYVKIDMDATTGVDRTGTNGMPELHFNEKFQGGGKNSRAQYNVQFELARPNVTTITPTGTAIKAQMRTTSGTSISGNEASFQDMGYEPISLSKNSYFTSPRIVASKINSSTFLGELPQNKSVQMNVDMTTSDSRISPVVDIEKNSMILVTNRVNKATDDYITDFSVKTVRDDRNNFYYVSNNITLANPATNITMYLDAYIHDQADLRAFYALDQFEAVTDTIFTPFPGYKNVEPNGVVLNTNLNDGNPDVLTPKVDTYISNPGPAQFREYKFTIDRVTPFTTFRIKLLGTSTNQAYPPFIRALRVIAYA